MDDITTTTTNKKLNKNYINLDKYKLKMFKCETMIYEIV